LIIGLFVFIPINLRNGINHCPDLSNIFGSLIVLGLFSLYFLWLAFKAFQQLRDVFYLRYELMLCGAASIIITILVPILIIHSELYIVSIVIGIAFALFTGSVIAFPTILTFLPEKNIFHYDTINSLQEVLSKQELSLLFVEYLAKELCIENIIFYQRVEELKKLNKNSEQEQKLANGIVHKFIVNDSPLQINIDFALQQKIISEVKNNNFDSLYYAQKKKMSLI